MNAFGLLLFLLCVAATFAAQPSGTAAQPVPTATPTAGAGSPIGSPAPVSVVASPPVLPLLRFSPPSLVLDGGADNTPTGLLTITSSESAPVRFQLQGATWTTDDSGQIQWQPSEALVAWPALFSLPPGRQQLIRVGVSATPGAVEQAYRLYLQELPDRSAAGSALTLVRWVGIPVWVPPLQPHRDGQLLPLQRQGNRLTLSVQNTGNVHFTLLQSTVQSTDASGQRLSQQPIPGAYVLAGKHVTRSIALPLSQCAAVRQVTVTVSTVEQQHFAASLPTPQGVCP